MRRRRRQRKRHSLTLEISILVRNGTTTLSGSFALCSTGATATNCSRVRSNLFTCVCQWQAIQFRPFAARSDPTDAFVGCAEACPVGGEQCCRERKLSQRPCDKTALATLVHLPLGSIYLSPATDCERASERPATQDRTCGRRFNCRGLCLSPASAQASGSKAVKPVVNCGEPFLLARSLARTQTQSDRSILSDRWAIWCSGQTSASAASGRLRAAHNAIHTIAKEPHSERAGSTPASRLAGVSLTPCQTQLSMCVCCWRI